MCPHVHDYIIPNMMPPHDEVIITYYYVFCDHVGEKRERKKQIPIMRQQKKIIIYFV